MVSATKVSASTHSSDVLPYRNQSGFAEVGLLSFGRSVSQDALLGDFLLAPTCPTDKCGKEQILPEVGLNPGPWVQDSVLYSQSYRFSDSGEVRDQR